MYFCSSLLGRTVHKKGGDALMKDIRVKIIVVLTLIIKLLEIIIWILVQNMKKEP